MPQLYQAVSGTPKILFSTHNYPKVSPRPTSCNLHDSDGRSEIAMGGRAIKIRTSLLIVHVHL